MARKAVKRPLRRRSRALSGIAGAIPLPLVVFDRTGSLTDANDAFLDFLGVRMADVAGTSWLSRVAEGDREAVCATVASAAAARQPFHLVCRLRSGNDGIRTCELTAGLWTSGGRWLGFASSVVDVTARDAAEQRARVSALSLRGMLSHAREAFFVVDAEDRIVQWNRAASRFLEKDGSAVVGEPLSVLVDSPAVAEALVEVRGGGGVREVSGVMFKGLATPLLCRIFAAGTECGVSLADDTGATGAIALEELRHSQDHLRRSEELYRAFIENSSEGIWRFETDRAIPVDVPVNEQLDLIMTHAYIAECNETLARFYGVSSASDLLRLRINGVVRMNRELLKEYIREFIVAGYRLNNIEVARRGPDGDTRFLLYSFSGTIERGALVRVWGVVRDVTERRVAERRLRLLAHTLTSTRDAVSITDMNNRVLFVNDAFLRQYGYPEEKLVGKDIAFVRAASTAKELEEEIHSTTVQGEWNGEVINRRADGSEFPVELWTSVVRNDEGEPVAMVGVARDITERKRTEESIRASLREKEVLLKEIHHRVKNNLQVISSLLSLQAEYLKDEAMLKIMRESQNRVKSMALVHEKLYQSQNLASIEFGEYVRELVTQLSRSYGMNPELIRMNITADAIELAVDRAIPCGIIVNELVSNALKYAFPGGRHGTIDVLLHNLPEGKIRLVIRDNGVGLPRDLELHNANSLGLTLVHMLADQVQGELAIPRNGAGTEFSLTFRK